MRKTDSNWAADNTSQERGNNFGYETDEKINPTPPLKNSDEFTRMVLSDIFSS